MAGSRKSTRLPSLEGKIYHNQTCSGALRTTLLNIEKKRLTGFHAKLSSSSFALYKKENSTSAEECYPIDEIVGATAISGMKSKKFWCNVSFANGTVKTFGFLCEDDRNKWVKALRNCQTQPKINEFLKDPSSITKETLLGEGAYGKVWKGKMKGTPVAIKEIYHASEDNSIEKEIMLLSMIHNPYCVRLLGLVPDAKDENRFCLITELVDEGDLTHVLRKHPHRLSEMTKLKILRDVARGLVCLHDNGVIHRDVKADNCLIRSIHPNASQFAVIADFGISQLAAQQGEEDECAKGMGTPVYMAPECFSHYTNKVDVYSFGVVINETFSEERPWVHIDTKFSSEILNRVEAGARPLQNFSETDYPHKQQIVDIINACWTHNSELRPDMTIVLDEIDNLIETIENETSSPQNPFIRASSIPNAYYTIPQVQGSQLTTTTPSYATVPNFASQENIQPPAYLSSFVPPEDPPQEEVPVYLRTLNYSTAKQKEEEAQDIPAYLKFD